MIDETSLENMALPKANYYEELETLSEQNFQILFHPSKFELGTRDRRDKGLDITYEIKRADKHTGFRFIVQLKATESIQSNKFGGFSVQLDTSNINYLLNNSCPAFYVLYEVNTKTFYYESITDFLKTLNKKDGEWNKQGTHVLNFSKQLLPGGIIEMYNTAQKNGLLQRNLKDSASLISASFNKSDRISIDANLNITDDAKIRQMIEALGFELINEGKWKEIFLVHKKASGNVASSALYNLILGIANYYGGSRWDAISFLKAASMLKSELDKEMQMHLEYFDTVVKYSIGLINDDEYGNKMLNLENSDNIGLYIKLEKAKTNYIESLNRGSEEKYDQYVKEIQEIINHPKANDAVKLTAKCELVLFEGFKNNSDYLSHTARLNGIEEVLGVDKQARIESVRKFMEVNTAWYKNVEVVIEDAAKSKNSFAYFTAIINMVKVSYQLYVYTSTFSILKGIPGEPKVPMPDKIQTLERLIKRIALAANHFSQIGHIENIIASYSTMFEIYHFLDDTTNANKIMGELESLIDVYDLKDHKKRLELLKNGGTTHENFKKWIAEIFGKVDIKKKEFDTLKAEMITMDEIEKEIKNKPTEGNYSIHLFPIGHFQFPINEKEKVYEILQINNIRAIETYNKIFEMSVRPIANIHYNPIEQEGYKDGNFADKGIENWRNIYRIRKAFFESKFYRL